MPIMNSDGVRPGATITDIRRKRAKPSGDRRFTLAAGASKATAEARLEPAVVSITSLLELQEVPSGEGEGTRANLVRRGEDLLDRLDDLRMALLAGVVPQGRLSGLADALRAERRISGDARLDHIIGEIELRAEVEVAKLARR